ncbi:hypothetical protein NQZ79_g244 [Umbelopsis isabellina]|nr:hypothetical protein NQZ79_g244 [Umbelopsis isabellina]
MLVIFSRKESDKGTIVKIEVDGYQTYFLFHNPTGEDLVAIVQYREYNFIPKRLIKETLVIPPYTTERIIGGKGNVELWAWLGATYEMNQDSLWLPVSFKDSRKIDAKNADATIEKYKATTLSLPAIKNFTARIYKLSYDKTKNGKTFNCDIHRVIMPEGVDLYCVQNKTDEELVFALNENPFTVGPNVIIFIKDKIASYRVKFLWLSKPTDTKDKRKIMTDEMKYVDSCEYSIAQDFIKHKLWDIVSRS